MLHKSKLYILLPTAFLVILLDQISKNYVAFDLMNPPSIIEITSFFNLVLAWNRGVSFSMFQSGSVAGTYVLIGIATFICVLILFWLFKSQSKITVFGLSLVIGGAIGNIIDRVVYGAVIDFLDFHALGYHWPAFNVADSAVCIGVALILLEELLEKNRAK